MDQQDQGHPAAHQGRGSLLWRRLTALTGGLYAAVGKSFLGRAMTAYRRADALLHHDRRRTLRDNCRPMSSARLRLVEAAREGKLFKLFSAFFSLLAYAPVSFYGFYLLFYGLLNTVVYFVGPLLRASLTFDLYELYLFAALALLGVPLLFSHKPTVKLLLTGRLTRWFFVSLLGLPEEGVNQGERSRDLSLFKTVSPYVAFLLALLSAVATFWIHPLIIPCAFLLLCAVGMVFAFPETGVMIAVTALPVLFLAPQALLPLAAVIAVTWAALLVKVLFMHRSIRFSLMDIAVLLFAASLCLAGMTGHYVTPESVSEGILSFVVISLYFLITNLMTTREQLKRCLLGPAAALLLVLAAVYVTRLPQGEALWQSLLGGGGTVKQGMDTVLAALEGVNGYGVCLPMMAAPLICGLLWKKKNRPLWILGVLAALALCVGGLILADAWGALTTVAVCLLLFFLLHDHRTLAAGLLALPWVACGGVWLGSIFSSKLESVLGTFFEGQIYRGSLGRSVWRLVCDHPAGVGLGDRAYAAVYPLYAETQLIGAAEATSLYADLMVSMGLPGLILCLFTLFLFLQKTFTCLKISGSTADSAVMLGGMLSVVTLFLYGFLSDAPTQWPAVYAAVIALGLCNAFENTVFSGWDMTAARMARDDHHADLVFHASGT